MKPYTKKPSNLKRGKHKRKNKSHAATIVWVLLGIVLVGDLIGVTMYVRQTTENREALVRYFYEGAANGHSFFEVFWHQTVHQLIIWSLGLTVLGNLVNGFLLLVRGVSTGFNLAFLVDLRAGTHGVWPVFLWSLQAFLVLFVTLLSVYFSVRFAYVVVKSIQKKKCRMLKKQLNLYVRQLAVVLVLTIFTSFVTALTLPNVTKQMTPGPHGYETSLEIEI